jgi:signal transduction histidine kinase
MLHQNLDAYLKERINESERFRLDDILDEQVAFFRPMYDYLTWEVDVAPLYIKSDKHAFARIVYNLLSNACKYNTSDGFIKIFTEEEKLIISNSSYGIKDPSRVFERFYKESERGLGIGLHIVEKLTNQLKIRKEIQAEESTITFILDLSQVTSK